MVTDGTMPRGGARGRAWLWWTIAALAVCAVAFGVGRAGGFGHPSAPAESLQVIGSVAEVAVGLDCPDGHPVTTVLSGAQVLIVGRSADGMWVGLRSAARDFETVWIASSAIDGSQPVDLSGVPIDACIVPLIERVSP